MLSLSKSLALIFFLILNFLPFTEPFKLGGLINLTESEFNSWYSGVEQLCMSDKLKSNECTDENLLLYDCVEPYASRTCWKKGVKGYTNPQNHTILSLIPKLFHSINNNVTIVWIGDSLTLQRIRFMKQDMFRHYKAGTISYDMIDKPEKPVEMGNNHKHRFFADTYPGPPVVMRHVHMTTLEYTPGHGHHLLANSVIDRVNYIEKSNALIIITMGAWFNRREPFQEAVREEVKWLKSVVQRTDAHNEALWLASWPQHFNTTAADGNGYFWGERRSNLGCIPHDTDHQDWRNAKLFKYLKEEEFSKYIHLYNDKHVMDKLWDMHVKPSDCTHFCYSPVLHQPLWDAIAHMLDLFDRPII